MSATYNQAVKDGWKRAADEIREPLRKQIAASGMDLDRMMEIMWDANKEVRA